MLRPLAVGLVEHPAEASEVARSRARAGVSLVGGREGYCLVEVFELEGVPNLDRAALAGLAEVIGRREITTAFVAGLTVLPDCLAELALIVVPIPRTGPVDPLVEGTTADGEGPGGEL
ncbi:MAG: hypothetical protein QG608_1443 [Actinomycetota bacterium]|nr:hypothetical protein [Actinomycetota bacterium]